MSGLTPLVDTLLATRLAQRVDLVPLKPEVQVAGPGPVTQVEEVINDVRLPSRAAVEQQLGVGPLKSELRGHGDLATARPNQAVTLSTAARTLSVILDGQTGVATRVVGSGPLLVSSQPLPSPAVIAATLARTVGHSGLFYESHLAQFAAGARSLAELAQEPQARLEGSGKAGPVLTGWPGAEGDGTTGVADRRAAQPVAPPAGETAPGGSGKAGVAAFLPTAEPDSIRQATSPEATHAHKNAYQSMQDADGPTPATDKSHDDSAPNAARSNAPPLTGIHQDAVALVRQQFELLAQPAFRWSGEAWPNVPMDWDIQEEAHEPASGGEAGAGKTWSTRLGLTLPTLGNLEVRISLTGQALQVRLAAAVDTACAQLRQAASGLPPRLRSLGLEVNSLQIAMHTAQQAMPNAAHVPDTPLA